MSVRILLADDHPIVRSGIRALLAAEPGWTVVGEVSDGLEVLPAVLRLRPDILILDMVLPNLHGLEALRQVVRDSPRTRVVVLSMWSAESYVSQALKHGAYGYVLKEAEGMEVVRAVRAAVAGRKYLCPPLSQQVIEAYVERLKASGPDLYDTLTSREREVFLLSAQGSTSGEIAACLFLSARTVESHRSRIARKLGTRSQTELVRFALRRGLLPPDAPAMDAPQTEGETAGADFTGERR